MRRDGRIHTLSAMKKALVSAAGPNMQEILACSEPTFEHFADTHGYDLVIDRQLQDHSQHQHPDSKAARWGKIALLEQTIRSHDLVVWMDADVMIHKFDRDIADDVPHDCFQAFVLELFPHRFNPNSGVWALRQDEESARFLEDVRGIGQLDHSWADQGAICTALGWDIGDRKRAAAPSRCIILPIWPGPVGCLQSGILWAWRPDGPPAPSISPACPTKSGCLSCKIVYGV